MSGILFYCFQEARSLGLISLWTKFYTLSGSSEISTYLGRQLSPYIYFSVCSQPYTTHEFSWENELDFQLFLSLKNKEPSSLPPVTLWWGTLSHYLSCNSSFPFLYKVKRCREVLRGSTGLTFSVTEQLEEQWSLVPSSDIASSTQQELLIYFTWYF